MSLTTLIASIAIIVGLYQYAPTLDGSAYLSGWILAGMMVFLTLYNFRKKLPYPPLLKSSTWLQLHIYVGLLTVVILPFHMALRWPTGPFEVTLFIVYALVAGSGIVGLFFSRTIPARLTSQGDEVLFERIPYFIRQTRLRAEKLTVDSVASTDTTTLADYYADYLTDYFDGPRHLPHHLAQSDRPVAHLLEELRSRRRYFHEESQHFVDDLLELIRAKAALDYQYAMQGVLKLWLFVHLPLTYVLMLLVIVHMVLVHTFVGVAP